MAVLPLGRRLMLFFSRRQVNWCERNVIVKAERWPSEEMSKQFDMRDTLKDSAGVDAHVLLFKVRGGTSCFWFSLRPCASHKQRGKVSQPPLDFDHCHTSSTPLQLLAAIKVVLSYCSVNRLSLISWDVFFLSIYLFPTPGTRRAAQLEFPRYEWRDHAAGRSHLGVLAFRSHLSSFALQECRFVKFWACCETYSFPP